jgi:hypothetical protein
MRVDTCDNYAPMGRSKLESVFDSFLLHNCYVKCSSTLQGLQNMMHKHEMKPIANTIMARLKVPQL